MHHDFAGTALLHGLGALGHQQAVIEAQAHLGRYRQMRWHSLAHRLHHAGNLCRVLQQRSATAVAVDHLGRAAEIDVNAFRAQPCQIGGVLGHADRVRPQQLRPHRHTGQRLAAIA